MTRLLLLAIWTGTVVAATVWTVGAAGPGRLQGYVNSHLVKTGRPLDLAIDGDGYFVVQDVCVDDGLLYTRHGRLSLNENGQLMIVVDDIARTIEPAIFIPPDATDIHVARDGTVTYMQSDCTTATQAGQILLAKFHNEELLPHDFSMYLPTDTSNPPKPGHPGQLGRGTIRQHRLEKSVLEEIVAIESEPIVNR
jgi:flagellar basal body rod protein FlgG